MMIEKHTQDISSESRNKRLQCYDQWTKLFCLPSKYWFKIIYENIWKTAAGQGDDYTTGCLLDHPYFKEH